MLNPKISKSLKKIIEVLVISVLLANQGNAQKLIPFKQGDRVVFVGNSITDGGHYHSYIWLYYMTHFPNRRIDIFNSGIGGDVARQIYDRLDPDVFAKNPTVITLTFGMNDTGYQTFLWNNANEIAKQKIQESIDSYKLIEKRLTEFPKVRKIMIVSSPYDETSKIKTVAFPNKNKAILEIADCQKESALLNKWEYIDLNPTCIS